MSNGEGTESNGSTRESSAASEDRATGDASSSAKKKTSKASKPRLTASQKNFNHKDAENKRRTAIRERFTELSNMVPGAQGHERSEQVMLGKTTEFLKDMLLEQRRLEKMADEQGIGVDDGSGRLTDVDYGGPQWKAPNMDQYEASKQKRGGTEEQTARPDDEDDG